MNSLYFMSFLSALGLSMALIPMLIKYSARLGLVDDPDGSDRKLHRGVMPRSGGLGIVLATVLALVLVLPLDRELLSFLAASVIIIAFGVWDDRDDLRPAVKLFGQGLGVAVAMAGGMGISDVPVVHDMPGWLCAGLTFIFVLAVINAVNFSDGMDGLAAGTSLMALVLIFALAVEAGDVAVATIALAVSAGVLGFLRFNTHPARIFMGDAGSQFLGFAIAWLAIVMSQRDTTPMTTFMPLLVLGIPIMDLLQVIPLRLSQGRMPWQPDRQNFHHQVAGLGLQQHEAVALIYLMQAVLLAAAWLLRYATDGTVLGVYVLYAGVIIGAIYCARLNGWQLRDAVTATGPQRRNPFFRRISGLHRYTGKFFGMAVTLFLGAAALATDTFTPPLLFAALSWAGVLALILVFSRNRWPLALGRLATYTATACLVYGLTRSLESELLNAAIDGALIIMALLLMVAIRITRRAYFWLTTQDLLVLLFIVILVPQIPQLFSESFATDSLVFRTCVTLYTCEYLLARGDSARYRLTLASICTLALLGVHLA